jgi:hypothetical protein
MLAGWTAMDPGAGRVAERLHKRFKIGRGAATFAMHDRLTGTSIGGHDT